MKAVDVAELNNKMPASVLRIDEIIERSEQGRTRPFLCRCEDGNLYYVKGRGAGRRSLLCEWLAGYLARAFGLPIPPFAVVQAPESLVSLYSEGSELGSGPAFGSRRVPVAQELTLPHLRRIPILQRRDVLVFDWWTHNNDRMLTGLGGNPNLLWDTQAGELVVIDHNSAFDMEFDPTEFSKHHVFSSDISATFQDLVEPDRYTKRFRKALAIWPEACQNIPEEWWFADEELTVPANFDLETTLATLNRYTDDTFWNPAT
jgi:hypothetical protein